MPELPKAYWFGQISSGNMSEVPLSYLERSVSVFSAERMEAVWQQLLRRHEMLRAIIRQDGVIEIVEKTSKVFTVIDLRSATMEQARREVERLHETMIARERPLDEWPLFDAHAVQLPDGTTRLMFAFCIAVFDAFSWFIVEREANALYQDPNAALPPLPRYADHVAQATAAEAGPERQRAVAYWEDRLAALPRGPSLPPAMTASRKRWHHSEFRLSREFGDGFKQTARALGLSKYSLATAAFAEAVAAWSKSRHFVLTLLIQSRPTGFSSVIGNFSSTIALEVDFRGRRSFRQRARDLHRRFLQDLQHRAASGIYISREINRRSGRAPTAIFPVAFSALWNDETSKECASVLGSFQRRCLQVPDIAIDVGLVETTDGVVCNLDARADLFPAGMLPDLELVFRQLLIDLAAGPEVADRLRPVLPPPRDRALIAEVNRTGAPIDGRLLHEPFLEQVRRRPTATAVISPERTLTYADLDRYSAALAHRLRKLGLRPNELVAVPMLRGWQQAAAVLAIHRAGGAYVPIDLALVPHERMLHIFRHAQVRFAITQLDAAGAIDWPTNSIILTVESDDEPITSTPEQSWPRARPEDIAYVIYTSGSTGMPKGVTIDHRGALNTVLDINQRFSVGAHDRVLALSSLGFDLSVWDIFGMFAVGGTLVMPPASERPDPTEWSHAAREHGVTIWNSVPKLLDITIDNIGGRNELWPSTLRLVMLSGDWIPTSLPERARALSSSVELISLGGATEGSIWSIYFPIGTVDPTWRSIPYGRPLANQTFHVLDDALAPRPVWATGELYIGGIGLAQGYWADEDKTNASFIVHPETKERLYRTGDLGRYMPDGNIEFLGREDSQVKVRGYRVELGEIEAVITKLPGVRETYVLSREAARSGANDRRRRATDITQLLPTDHSVDKQLVAYVIPEPGVTLDTADLRARVAEMVPDYMVPTFLVVLTTGIPRSANGKVNRRELPPPEELGGVRAKHQLAPRDALETSLHALFCRVLGTDQLGVDDSFFELGGDSVMLVRVLSQIRQQHGREISVSAFALDPRVSSIARLIRERPDGNSAERSLLALRQDGDHDPLFLVHPVGGSGLAYLTLAQQIQPRRPIYALQSRGLESDDPPRETIEDMATAYLVAVKSVQPTGPYLLGGWSLGGTIAFEMAGQLHDRGEQASVLMIDSWAPNGFVTGSPIGESALVEWFRRDVTSVAGLARGTRELGPNRGALSPSLRRQFAVYSANIRAARSYEPKARAILISLIRASVVSTTFATHPALRNPSLDDRLLGWGALTARGIELQSCPGDHYSIISSHVDTLATLVDESVCLLDGDSRVDAHSRVGQ